MSRRFDSALSKPNNLSDFGAFRLQSHTGGPKSPRVRGFSFGHPRHHAPMGRVQEAPMSNRKLVFLSRGTPLFRRLHRPWKACSYSDAGGNLAEIDVQRAARFLCFCLPSRIRWPLRRSPVPMSQSAAIPILSLDRCSLTCAKSRLQCATRRTRRRLYPRSAFHTKHCPVCGELSLLPIPRERAPCR